MGGEGGRKSVRARVCVCVRMWRGESDKWGGRQKERARVCVYVCACVGVKVISGEGGRKSVHAYVQALAWSGSYIY